MHQLDRLSHWVAISKKNVSYPKQSLHIWNMALFKLTLSHVFFVNCLQFIISQLAIIYCSSCSTALICKSCWHETCYTNSLLRGDMYILYPCFEATNSCSALIYSLWSAQPWVVCFTFSAILLRQIKLDIGMELEALSMVAKAITRYISIFHFSTVKQFWAEKERLSLFKRNLRRRSMSALKHSKPLYILHYITLPLYVYQRTVVFLNLFGNKILMN